MKVFINFLPPFLWHVLLFVIAQIPLLKRLWLKNNHLKKLTKDLPGPTPLSLLGNVLSAIQLLISKNPRAVINKWHEKYGSMYRLRAMDEIIVVLGGVDNFQIACNSTEIMGRQFHKTFTKFGGDGLFSSAVSVWRMDRKTLQPNFTKNALKCNISKMNDVVQQFVEKLKHLQNGGEFNVREHCMHFVMNFFSQTQFNYRLNDQEVAQLDIREDSRKIMFLIASQEIVPWLKWEPYPFNLIYKSFLRPIKEKYNKIIRKMLHHKLMILQNEEQKNDSDFDVSSTIFASNLKNEMKKEEWMLDHIRSLIGAGTDTVTETLSFCLLMIAMHPDVQNKMYEEILEVFDDSDRLPTHDDLERLEYLNQVVKETQRLWTLTPFVVRVVDGDFKIGSHLLPAGTTVFLDLISVHFNPSYYPKPFDFNPDNFSIEAMAQRPKYSFMPFSAGPRMCIGKEYTEIEVKLTLTALLRAYSFHTTKKMENIKTTYTMIVYSPTGYPISISPRK